MSNRKKPKNRFLAAVSGFTVPTKNVTIPEDEKVVIKEVPAKVDGEVVGTAQIYDDGTVGVILNEDISEEAKNKIGMNADFYGFKIDGKL